MNKHLILLSLSLFCVSLGFVEVSLAAEHPGYIDAPERRTTGVGKFYMGREISFVMGHQAAAWLNRPERIQEEMPDEVVANMGLNPDDIVADIGAGSGYFSFRIAKLVPDGKVLAVDIQPEMLQLIERQKVQGGVSNIEGVLGRVDRHCLELGHAVQDAGRHLEGAVLGLHERDGVADVLLGPRVAVQGRL